MSIGECHQLPLICCEELSRRLDGNDLLESAIHVEVFYLTQIDPVKQRQVCAAHQCVKHLNVVIVASRSPELVLASEDGDWLREHVKPADYFRHVNHSLFDKLGLLVNIRVQILFETESVDFELVGLIEDLLPHEDHGL